jgi:hypothetical protein
MIKFLLTKQVLKDRIKSEGLKVKIHEKIRLLIEENKLNLTSLHKKVKELFGDEAITYLTLYRTVHGLTKIRESSLFQIASALGMAPVEIKKGTDEEIEVDRYEYSKNAYFDVLTKDVDFLPIQLVLNPGAKTLTEQDPIEKGNFIKWVYPQRGEITCVITTENGIERHELQKTSKPFWFKSTCPHYFENTSNRKSTCLIIQTPKYR